MTLYYDLETRSRCDLLRAGSYRYAESPSTEILLIAWAIDDGPVTVTDLTAEPVPPALWQALNEDTCVVHNAAFERPVVRHCLGADVSPERYHDTAAQARTLALPHSLDALGRVVGLDNDQAKDKDGKRLIRAFSLPQKNGRFIEPSDRPEDWQRFIEYARQDVEAMREIYRRLPTWVYRGDERRVWELDQHINDRGFLVDTELARRAIELTDAEQHNLAERVRELTDGEVGSATQRDQLLRYLRDTHGVELPDMREQTLLSALRGDSLHELPNGARELIRCRLKASKTSTAKYQAVVEGACHDDRLRGGLFYYGAHTGRWSGRQLQPQNLPRPSIGDDEIHAAVDGIKAGAADLLYDEPMQVASDCIRSVITAPDKLVVSDLSNIEGRALAWQAGEEWKLDAFRAFDRGEGPDLYNVTAASILGCQPDNIDKHTRTALGKVPELALGFAGGAGAFQSMAAIYGTRMADYWPTLQMTLPASAIERAEQAWETRGKLSEVEHDEWVASEAVKVAWRDRHPETVAYWYEVENAAKSAVQRPGSDFTARRILFRRIGHWLVARLPSRRLLVYPWPRIVQATRGTVYGSDKCAKCKGEGCKRCGGIGYTETREDLQVRRFRGSNGYWETTYSGRLVENLTQAIARDVLASGLAQAEKQGFRPVLTVHDEIICERGTEPELSAILSTPPNWCPDMPLASAGYEATRFKKD